MTAPDALAGAVDPARAREAARDILSEEPFAGDDFPRPFEGILRRLGELVIDPIGRFFSDVGDALPDAGSPAWIALALGVMAVAGLVAARLIAGRGRERPRRLAGHAEERGTDPGELERRAEAAEREGRLEEALRLRFRAGLLRLDALGAVELRPGLTNRAVARALRSRRFDGLAGHFDEVVYGGRAATAGDVGEARAGWPAVLEEARAP